MNPSANGWIAKFESLLARIDTYKSFEELYSALKSTGFVYGTSLYIIPSIATSAMLDNEEKAKINLLAAFYYSYVQERAGDFASFLEILHFFYTQLDSTKLAKKETNSTINLSVAIEKIMDQRVYLFSNFTDRLLDNVVTNALLFIDVLLFKRFLNSSSEIKKQAQKLEFLVLNVIGQALAANELNNNSQKILKLINESLVYLEPNVPKESFAYETLILEARPLYERNYLLDIACITVMEDHNLNKFEDNFIRTLGLQQGLNKNDVTKALEEVLLFFKTNNKAISYLRKDIVSKQLYEGLTKILSKAILRNSARLRKELKESTELVVLLSKSTKRKLTTEEKRKVKNQLLDIFKSIPSLAIFILPGGALLLPLCIKLLPNLLPYAFDDNRVEEKA